MDTINSRAPSNASVFEASSKDPQLAITYALEEIDTLLAKYRESNDVLDRMALLTEIEALRRFVLVRGALAKGLSEPGRNDGRPMGKLFFQSRFAASVEEISALVEDTKAAHPELSVVVLDHFHAMGSSPGFGPNTTAELAARAMALKAWMDGDLRLAQRLLVWTTPGEVEPDRRGPEPGEPHQTRQATSPLWRWQMAS